jgi:hypothetical protein
MTMRLIACNAALAIASAALHAAGHRTNSNARGHYVITVESTEHSFYA